MSVRFGSQETLYCTVAFTFPFYLIEYYMNDPNHFNNICDGNYLF